MSDKIIQMENVSKWFGDFQALKDINLEVSLKEKIVVCGPSGSGKSTLIRCINRLEEHQKGKIVVDGIELSENTKNIEQIRAEVGMVFQQFNLFPHLSILDNCALAPIWVRKMPKKQAEELALRELEKVANRMRPSVITRCATGIPCGPLPKNSGFLQVISGNGTACTIT